MALGDGVMICDEEAVMKEVPRGAELIVVEDFNVDLEGKDGRGRDEEIVVAIATAGPEDLAGHFLPRQWTWCKYWSKWEMVRKGRVMRSHTYYILGSNRRIFQNVDAQDPRHNSDHIMFIGCMCSTSPREHLC